MTRVAFLGPAGTWSEAALEAEPAAAGAERIPRATLPDVIAAVGDGAADYAVAPVQNSLEGGVNATLDTLVDTDDLEIVGETTLAIHHSLIAAPGTTLDAVREVRSHPQGIAQCQAFLREVVPGAEVLASASTSRAVADAVAAGPGHAAIGTPGAAALYGGEVLREAIEDDAGNATRFIWLARRGTAPWPSADGARWRTSVVFWGAGDGEAGWLVGCLTEFADRGLNMTRIESRPQRGTLEHFRFFVDLDARAGDDAVRDALVALAARCEAVRVLGSYPAA